MSERTETVEMLIPVPPSTAAQDVPALLAERAAEGLPAHLQDFGLQAVSEPTWTWTPLTLDEALSRFAEDRRQEMAQYLENSWLGTAEVRVAETEAVSA